MHFFFSNTIEHQSCVLIIPFKIQIIHRCLWFGRTSSFICPVIISGEYSRGVSIVLRRERQTDHHRFVSTKTLEFFTLFIIFQVKVIGKLNFRSFFPVLHITFL